MLGRVVSLDGEAMNPNDDVACLASHDVEAHVANHA